MLQPRQSLKYQNSYRLASRNPFVQERLETILNQVMNNHFSKVERFDSKLTAGFCRVVSDEIIEKVKGIKSER